VGAALLLGALALCAMPALSAGPVYQRDQRFGIAFVSEVTTPSGVLHQSLSDYAVKRLGVGWYSDWKYSANPAMPADMTLDYAQLIRVRDQNWPPDWEAVRAAAQARRGSTWMIGNEPECPNQDALTPEVYAARYREAYQKIKGYDGTAQIAIGAIVQPSALRFRWLDRVLAAHQTSYGSPMPVDVWNIHVQILSEWAQYWVDDPSHPDGGYVAYNYRAGAGIPVGIDPVAEGLVGEVFELPYTSYADPAVFQSMVTDFREWMKAKGQQNKPLIISEMGVLYPSFLLVEGGSEAERQARGDAAIEAFMRSTFGWLLDARDPQLGWPADEDRLVQRWLWFSLNGSFWEEGANERGFNGSLYDYQTKQPTRFGRVFIALQSDEGQVFLPIIRRR
jgi:hypothetical protein